MEDLFRIAELEAKLEILQARFDKLRGVVAEERDRLIWQDDGDISKARQNLQAALMI